jgi:hypothetical protein
MKIIVYTCILNGYDKPKKFPILPKDKSIEFICFNDGSISLKGTQWKSKNYHKFSDDPILNSRYHKLHPTEVLPDHDISIWIDGSMHPVKDIREIVQYCIDQKNKLDIPFIYAARPHPGWNCLYKEASAIIRFRRDVRKNIDPLVDIFRHEHVPNEVGLHETGVLIRDTSDAVLNFDDEWWSRILMYSKRDQMHFDYLRWKKDYPIIDISNAWFKITWHGQ